MSIESSWQFFFSIIIISHAFTMLSSVCTSILSAKQLIMLFQMWYACVRLLWQNILINEIGIEYCVCGDVVVLMKTENQYVCCVTYLCDAYALINIGIKVIMINGTHFFLNENIFNMVININNFMNVTMRNNRYRTAPRSCALVFRSTTPKRLVYTVFAIFP